MFIVKGRLVKILEALDFLRGKTGIIMKEICHFRRETSDFETFFVYAP